MSVLLVGSVEQNVPMNETGRSQSTIGTQYLGPCTALLLTFKFDGNEHAILMHYSHSIRTKNKNNHGLLTELIQLLEHISTETRYLFQDQQLIIGSQLCLSNLNLIVAGGDPLYSKSIHNALFILNRKLNFPIEVICTDNYIRLFYYELLGHVTIFKNVSKMLPSDYEVEEEDDDEDVEVEKHQQSQPEEAEQLQQEEEEDEVEMDDDEGKK